MKKINEKIEKFNEKMANFNTKLSHWEKTYDYSFINGVSFMGALLVTFMSIPNRDWWWIAFGSLASISSIITHIKNR